MRLRDNFEGNKKMYWKEVKRVKKGEKPRDEMVKDANGQILPDGVEVRRRWAEYFEQVLNVADVWPANINVAENWQTPMLGDLNGRAISLVEVREAVNEIKSGKVPLLDGFPVECLKKGGMAVLEWLVRLLNVSFTYGQAFCMYRGKGDKCECSNSRGTDLLSVSYMVE